jgi:phosphate transport system protein
MARLMDLGLDKLTNMILEMAKLSESTVATAIQSYMEGRDLRDETFAHSEKLRILQDEVSELAVEVIARYQPVASDLRYIKSCMEIAYGFLRFGRYAYDISEVLAIYGDLSECDKSEVETVGDQAKKMIRVSIKAFTEKNVDLANALKEMDDIVDNSYRNYLRKIVKKPKVDLKCSVSATLVLRYLERIADHATYIGESVVYTVSGQRTHMS